MCARCFAAPIYQFDFKTDPKAAGWVYASSENGANKFVYLPAEGYYENKGGKLTGPKIACTGDSFQFYLITFESKSEINGYCAVFFQDKDGQEIVADTYALIYPSKNWAGNVVCFRGREGAATFTVNFIGKQPVAVRDLKVTPVDNTVACKWADELYATLPPLEYKADPNRWKLIPKTIKRLEAGGPIRVVMLGDSIINDTNNSNWDALLMRMYPKADIHVICSVRGSTGCWYYKDVARHQGYVVDLKPDFLIIGGISHQQDQAAIRAVIKLTRAKCDCEILLMSGPVGPDWREHDKDNLNKPLAKAAYKGDEFNDKLRKLAEEEKVEFLDMNTPWHEYLGASGKPYEWFHRDYVHANDRGKQILGRIIEKYFAP